MASAKDLSTAFRVAADRVLPSLVTIETTVTRRPWPMSRGIRQRRLRVATPSKGLPLKTCSATGTLAKDFALKTLNIPSQPEHGLGSGVIFDASGLIMTNNHVVAGGKNVSVLVRLSDGREFVADEVWTDPKTDIAVVKISGAKDLVPAQLADSDQVAVGDWVLAMGQPFGLESTVTAGIISATHRGVGINARETFLQTDAAINPGNSGGPLVNLDGQVVGINTAISSRGGGNDGVGFAVPINLAKWVAEQLADGGAVRRAYLGVGIQSIDAKLAEQFGVKPRQGVLVTEVYPDTPAAKAGLKAGDVIVEYAGIPVSSPQDLQVIVERSKLGHRHDLKVVREGQMTTLGFVPEEQPDNFGEQTSSVGRMNAVPSSSGLESFGVDISDLTADVARQLGMKEDAGVVITDVEDGSVCRSSRPGARNVDCRNRSASRSASVDDCKSILEDHDQGSRSAAASQIATRLAICRAASRKTRHDRVPFHPPVAFSFLIHQRRRSAQRRRRILYRPPAFFAIGQMPQTFHPGHNADAHSLLFVVFSQRPNSLHHDADQGTQHGQAGNKDVAVLRPDQHFVGM